MVTIIFARADSNQLAEALSLFQNMCLTVLIPNEMTLLHACSQVLFKTADFVIWKICPC